MIGTVLRHQDCTPRCRRLARFRLRGGAVWPSAIGSVVFRSIKAKSRWNLDFQNRQHPTRSPLLHQKITAKMAVPHARYDWLDDRADDRLDS